MIQICNVSKSYGDRVLFSGVNLVINPFERVGLVGRNGMGKSTLFKLIRGEEGSDGGQIKCPKNYRIGTLEQHLHFSRPTILEEVALGLTGEGDSQLYRGERILFGLGFSEEDLEKPPTSFSGGYQIRINLAKVLVSEPNMLLLDEPTNYLDIVSLIWLRRFLRKFPGEVIMITHDREFMDSICTHTMGIVLGKIKKIKGSTERFYEQISLEEKIYDQTRLNQEKKKKELQNFVDRFRAKASKASQAQSKLKQIRKMGVLEERQSDGDLGFFFHYQECPGRFPLEAKDLGFAYHQNPLLFKNLSFSLERQDRLGIIGKNGKGKSTLLNLIAGNLELQQGGLKFHPSAQIGYFGQTHIEHLDPHRTVCQEIAQTNPKLSHTEVRNIAGSMMFRGDDADKRVEVLSGGEKSRVLLGKILAKPTNILLLDEPTNHLDMESVEVLCRQMEKFKGAIIIVTHSEMLLKRLAHRLIIFHQEGQGAEFFHGGYDDFLRKVGWKDEVPKKEKKKAGHKKKISQKILKTDSFLQWQEEREQIENDIIKLEELLKKYNALLKKKSEQGEDLSEVSQMIAQIYSKIEEKFKFMEEVEEKINSSQNKV